MYTQQEKQNKYSGRHSRACRNPVNWISVPASAGLKALREPTERLKRSSRDLFSSEDLSVIAGMTNDQLLSQTKTLVQKERNINV